MRIRFRDKEPVPKYQSMQAMPYGVLLGDSEDPKFRFIRIQGFKVIIIEAGSIYCHPINSFKRDTFYVLPSGTSVLLENE